MSHPLPPATLNEADAATYLGVSRFTLRQARAGAWAKPYRQPRGPAYVKLGRTVRYRVADLDAYLEAHRIDRRASA